MRNEIQMVWEKKVREAAGQQVKSRLFTAFNTNVDVITHVTPEDLASVLQQSPELNPVEILNKENTRLHKVNTPLELMATVVAALQVGKSVHIVTESDALLDWLDAKFTNRREMMGGQAGIVANQIANLGAESVIYTRLISQKQAQLIEDGVVMPVVSEAGMKLALAQDAYNPEHQTKINWIFEYGKGLEFDLGGVKLTTPRANRVILATRPQGAVQAFGEEIIPHLPQLGRELDVAFMAGYHYIGRENPGGLGFKEFLAQQVQHLDSLRQENPDLKFHYEYVPMKERDLEREMLTEITQVVKSFGINENEIKMVLDEFGLHEAKEAVEKEENAYTLYKAALALFRHLSLDRLHLHNLGYYVVILRKPYHVSPQRAQEACLYATCVNALKARYGGYAKAAQLSEAGEWALSDIGYNQLMGFVEAIKGEMEVPVNFLEEGILEGEDHYLLITPAHVIPNPVSTVGMGDTISSSSFALECTK